MDVDPDPICPGRLESDPDPVNIRRDPPPCFDYNYIYQKKRAANVGLNFRGRRVLYFSKPNREHYNIHGFICEAFLDQQFPSVSSLLLN